MSLKEGWLRECCKQGGVHASLGREGIERLTRLPGRLITAWDCAVQTSPRTVYRFGPFAVDAAAGELLKQGKRVKIQDQPFRLLLILLDNPGEVVTRAEIESRIWEGNTFVDFDSSLRVAVGKLREALGDEAGNPHYIETVPKRGYRFLGPVAATGKAEAGVVELPGVRPVPECGVVAEATPLDGVEGRRWVRAWVRVWARSRAWVAGALLVAGVAAGAWFVFLRTHRVLGERDILVLTDFDNRTGDAVFDGTLRQGLAIQLEQSPFLRILDEEQVHRGLRLMGVPPGGRITFPIAHDLCVRDGAAATIEDSIVSLGRRYVITLEATACQGGATLARVQTEAEDKEHVLRALGAAATAVRSKLGESHATIEKLNRPLEQVTTGSLEALQNYTAGSAALGSGQFLSSVPLFERAVALDPNFAMAYYYLGMASLNAGDTERQRDYQAKAFGLIDRVSEYERYAIANGYYQSTGELYKDIGVERSGIANYPRFWGFHNNLSTDLIDLGQFEEGLREGLAAAELQPDAEPPYRRLLDAYMCLGRMAEARDVAKRVRMRGIDGARIHQRFLEMAYVEGDEAAAAWEIHWFAGRPEEYLSLGLQAAKLNVAGRRLQSSELYRRAADTAQHAGLRSVAAGFEEADAQADALAGDCRTVRRLRRPALALAMCGETVAAEELIEERAKVFPNATLWNAVRVPEVLAALRLQRQPASAVELLAPAAPYERAYPEVVYLRGLAYLQLHKGAEAAAEFRKIVDHPGASWGSTWLYPNWGLYSSIAYLGLARGLALEGDWANAKVAYGEFFARWRDADASPAILSQARAEYAHLH